MGIEDVAADLYGMAPEEFTAARNARAAQAKAEGDPGLAAAVRGLRRPTVGAWLLNRLVRERAEEVEQVLDLGARLRAAQGTLGAADLRALDTSRRALTRAVAGQAVDIGRGEGRTVSAAVAAAVEETLRSAMVDPDAGAALATGLLTDTFSASGLDPVDLSRAVALGGVDGAPRGSGSARAKLASVESAERHEREVAQARTAVADAESAQRTAGAAAEEARHRAVAARRRHEELRSEVEEARRRLADLEERLPDAAEADDAARRTQLATTRDERSATEAADRARRRLEALLDR